MTRTSWSAQEYLACEFVIPGNPVLEPGATRATEGRRSKRIDASTSRISKLSGFRLEFIPIRIETGMTDQV